MTATQQFIEDAVSSGYRFFNVETDDEIGPAQKFYSEYPFRVLLDPLAWQAVGKTRGWTTIVRWSNLHPAEEACVGSNGYEKGQMVGTSRKIDVWRNNLHHFIDHLADGKTIEEALLTLKK